MSKFTRGTKFSSYDEFQSELRKYCKENFHEFWKRDARTLQSGSKLKPSVEHANPNLKYHYVKVCCIKGGRSFKKGKDCTFKRNTRTWREGCPAFIALSLSKDGQFLVVKSSDLCHTHETSEVLHKMLPQNRRLPEHAQKEAITLLHLGVNKKSVAEKLSHENNKSVLLRDLSNIAYRAKSLYGRVGTDDLNAIVKTLQKTYNCGVNLLQKDNELEGIFFQDEEMYNSFKRFPELLTFDGAYKLTHAGFVCYIFMVEDSNGCSEAVGVGLLVKEDKASVEWLVDAFKERNESSKTRAIMTDKDFSERAIFKEKFPDAGLLICLFHTLRTFKSEITCEKYGLAEDLKCSLKNYLQQLAYSYTEEQYFEVYQKFCSVAPEDFLAYYVKNWHPIREEWTRMTCSTGNYKNSANNRLEGFKSKLKYVIKSHTSLSVFIDKFFVSLHQARTEQDNENIRALQKVPIPQVADSTEDWYSKLLTPYAYQYILKQLETCGENIVQKIENGNYYYSCEGRTVSTNYNECSCTFFRSMRLPCRHILATRHDMGLSLYDEVLCDERWTRKKLMSSRIMESGNMNSGPLKVNSKASSIPKTQLQKYQEASHLTAELAQILSETSGASLKMKMEQIEELIRYWEDGKEVALVSVEAVPNNFASSSSAASLNVMDLGKYLQTTSGAIESVQHHDIIQSMAADNNQSICW